MENNRRVDEADFSLLAQTSPAAWRRHAGGLTPLFVAR